MCSHKDLPPHPIPRKQASSLYKTGSMFSLAYTLPPGRMIASALRNSRPQCRRTPGETIRLTWGNVLSTLIGDEDSKSTMSAHHHIRGIEHQ